MRGAEAFPQGKTKMASMTTKPGPSTLYHYTSMGGLLGLAKSRELWASNIRYLNDSTEYLHTIHQARLVRDTLIEALTSYEQRVLNYFLREYESSDALAIMRGHTGYYVFSLTPHSDSLSQWRAYAPKSGYAVGWTTDALQRIAAANKFTLKRCIYDDEVQREMAKGVLEETLNELRPKPLDLKFQPTSWGERVEGEASALREFQALQRRFDERIGAVAAVCKNPAFRAEDEWRLVSDPRPLLGDRDLRFREGRSVLVPYVPIKLAPADSDDVNQSSLVVDTVCGPSPELALSQQAAIQVFSTGGWRSVNTGRSLVPFRDW